MGYDFREHVDSQDCLSIEDPFVVNIEAQQTVDWRDERDQDQALMAAMQAAADSDKESKMRRAG